MYPGRVAGIEDDFLGRSVWLRHDQFLRDGACLYTVYGHTSPVTAIGQGDSLSEGEIFATIRSKARAGLPYHLHISMLWVPESIRTPSWAGVGKNKDFVLVDPLIHVAGKRWNPTTPELPFD